jgi:hypothetical protein
LETNHHASLTAPEVASLWSQYMFETMSICFTRYALNHMEDEDIRNLYEHALVLSKKHVEKIKTFFSEEGYPIPVGFNEKDVNINAPRLFQDPFYLQYLYVMSMQGLTGYALSVSTSVREDVRAYYIQCNTDTMELYNKIMELLLSKGLMVRPPVLTPKEMVSFAKKQNFLSGWIGNRRPLTAMEIGDISFNMTKMNLHIALKLGLSQVAESKDVRNVLTRGVNISNKHVEVFKSIFDEEKLNSPISFQALVTNSNQSPFSDKLIMYQIQYSTQIAIAFYGAALSVNARRDLGGHYTRLTGELLKYAEDCANLIIEKGWLEEPPMASDRDVLSKKD